MIDRLRAHRRIQGWRPVLAPPRPAAAQPPRLRWARLPVVALVAPAQYLLLLAIDAQLAIADVLNRITAWCLEE